MKYVFGILYAEVAKQLSGLRFDRYFGVYHKNHELHFTQCSIGQSVQVLSRQKAYTDSFFARHWLNFSIYDLFLKRYESKYYNIQMSTLCASYKENKIKTKP